MFALLAPLLNVAEKILLEAFLWTDVVLQFIDQMTAMLLVHCAQILLLIDAGRISAYNPGDDLVITNESHVGPAPEAQVVPTWSFWVKQLDQIAISYQRHASFLEFPCLFICIIRGNCLQIGLPSIEYLSVAISLQLMPKGSINVQYDIQYLPVDCWLPVMLSIASHSSLIA